MTDKVRRAAAAKFASEWKRRGNKKSETQSFWLTLLQRVYDVEEPEKYIAFEMPVEVNNTTCFIDGYISEASVLIEQKSWTLDLTKKYKQSDGEMLTPFKQAEKYAWNLPRDLHPRWIVVCNFQEFSIHDMNRPNDEPEILKLCDLEKEFHRLQFLVDTDSKIIKKETRISLQADKLVGILYDALLKLYKDPDNPETPKQRCRASDGVWKSVKFS